MVGCTRQHLLLCAVCGRDALLGDSGGVRERIKATVEELQERGHKNWLPHIPPDERMRRVDEAIATAQGANAEGGVVEALFTRHFQYDVVRHLAPRLHREVGDPVPGSRVAGILRFLISPPLPHRAKGAGRIVSALAMVTLVPASLAVTSADLSQEIPREERPGSSEESDQPKTEGEQDKKERCEAVGAVLPTDACVAAAEFGAAFEAAWGASLLYRSGAPVQAEEAGISDARRAWAQRQVLPESVAPRMATFNVAETASGTSDRPIWPPTVMDAEIKAWTGSGPITNFGKLAGNILGTLAGSVSRPAAVEIADRPLTLRELAATAASVGVGLSIDSVRFVGTEPIMMDKLLSGALKEALGKLTEEDVRRLKAVKWLRRSAELAAMDAALRVRDAKRAVGDPMGMVEVFIDPDLARNFKGTIDQVTSLEFPK